MIGEASAPASSANLGPGFDTIAIALSLRCIASAEPSEGMTLTEGGSTSRLPPNDLIAKTVERAVGRPMHVTLANEVPRARGLGSSAAVIASVAAASLKAIGADRDPTEVYRIVCELEGHPDNAAATVFGGLVAATHDGVQRLDLHSSLLPVVAIPETRLRTSNARAALTSTVERDVVTRSLGRLAFLIEGLASGNADVLRHAAGDELHEAPRSLLSPITGQLIEAARKAGAVHACWSGAGPTALAFATADTRGRVIGTLGGVLGTRGEVLALNVDTEGLT
jgi:homoserine kinase